MKQVSETTWLPYPECKPDRTGSYTVTIIVNKKRFISCFYWNGYNWYDSVRDSICNGYVYDCVISFCNDLLPYDPEAKKVIFTTADLVMRERMHKRLGIVFKSLTSNEYIEYADGRYYRFTNYEDRDSDEERTRRAYGFEDDEGISIAEIMGEWEIVK